MPIIDSEEAVWLGGLLGQAVVEIEAAPGVTVEVEGDTTKWVQVLPVESVTEQGQLDHFLLNMPYRGYEDDPLKVMGQLGITPPPGTSTPGFEIGHYARLRLRRDVPLVGLAHFVAELLEKVVKVDEDAELAVQFDYGF